MVFGLESGPFGALVGNCEPTERPIFGWMEVGKGFGSGVTGIFNGNLALLRVSVTGICWRGTEDVMMDKVAKNRMFWLW